MEQEIKTALEGMKASLDQKMNGLDAQIEAKANQLLADAEAKLKTAQEAEIKAIKDAFETRLDAIVADMKAKKANPLQVKSFEVEFAKSLEEKHAELKGVSAGRSVTLELKDVTINTNNSVTGSLANEAGGAVIRQGDLVTLPNPLINFAQLCSTVVGTEDTIRIWRETGDTNAFARVNKGADKPEQALSTPPVVFTAQYLAAIYRFDKSMLRNLPWMQQRLPQMLRRKYFKAENSGFYTTLATAATSYAGSLTGIEALVDSIGQLEAADFPVNGIVINPADWAKLSLTRPGTDNNYSLPSTVVFQGGQLTVNGVPVFKASFVPADKFIVGDWSQIYKYVTDGLKVEFFEQDVDNVQKNAITTRVEESNVLVIEQPLAFVTGDLGFVAPSI